MEKKLSDYLHLYLIAGIYCETPMGVGKLIDMDVFEKFGFGMNPGYQKYFTEDIKPILRPFESMRGEEIMDIAEIVDCFPVGWQNVSDCAYVQEVDHPNKGLEVCYKDLCSVRLTNKGDFYFTNKDKTGAIYLPKTNEVFRYLLSKHFDLFGLIEAGLAIDSTTLNPTP